MIFETLTKVVEARLPYPEDEPAYLLVSPVDFKELSALHKAVPPSITIQRNVLDLNGIRIYDFPLVPEGKVWFAYEIDVDGKS